MSSTPSNASVGPAAAPRRPSDALAAEREDAQRQRAAVGGDGLPPASPAPAPERDLEAVVRDLRETAKTLRRALEFRVEVDGGTTVVRVLDRETGELVRQMPAEQIVALAERLTRESDSARQTSRGRGQILDERA